MKGIRYIRLALFLIGIAIMISLRNEDNMGLTGAALLGMYMVVIGLLGFILTVLKPPAVGNNTKRYNEPPLQEEERNKLKQGTE